MRGTTNLYSAFGETKSITGWLADPRCMVSRDALRNRIRRGWDMERAVSQNDRFDTFERKKAPVKATGVAPRGYPPLVRVELDVPTRITNSSSRAPYVPPFMGRL